MIENQIFRKAQKVKVIILKVRMGSGKGSLENCR